MKTVECDECGCCVERKDECPVCCSPLPKAAAKVVRVRRASPVRFSARAWLSGLALLMATGLAIRHHGVLVMVCVVMLIAGIVSFVTSPHDQGYPGKSR